MTFESVLSEEERDNIKLDAREEYEKEQALEGLDVDPAEAAAISEVEVQEPDDDHISGPDVDEDEDEGFFEDGDEEDLQRPAASLVNLDDGKIPVPAPNSLEEMVPDRGESDISPSSSLPDDEAIDISDDSRLRLSESAEVLTAELSTNGADGDDEGYGSSDDEAADRRAWKADKRKMKEQARLEAAERDLDDSPPVSEQGIQEMVTPENASPVASPMNSLPPSSQTIPRVEPPLSSTASRPEIIGPDGGLQLGDSIDPKNLERFKNRPADEILSILRKTMEDPKAREALKSHHADFPDGSSTNDRYVHAAVEAALRLGPRRPSDNPNSDNPDHWRHQVQRLMEERDPS